MNTAGIYQIKGPFAAGTNVLTNILPKDGNTTKWARVGISIDTKDWMPLADAQNGFSFTINSDVIQMGRTCMYETSQPIRLDSIVFNQDAPESTIVNLIGYQD